MMWEYGTIIKLPLTADDLNAVGAQGWEHYLTIGNVHYLKRQIVVVAKGMKDVKAVREKLPSS